MSTLNKLAVAIFAAIFLVSFTPKTPNYGWMGAISSPQMLLDTSMWDIILPVFRPLTFRKNEYRCFG